MSSEGRFSARLVLNEGFRAGRRIGLVAAIGSLMLGVASCANDPDASKGELGPSIFQQSCAGCHGPDGNGGQAPPIGDGRTVDKYTVAEQRALVAGGRNAMPAFGSKLSAAEIAAVVAFVRDDLGRGVTTTAKSASIPTSTANATSKRSNKHRGAPPEVAKASNWALANGDYSSHRSVLESPINSRTVDQLEVAWTYDVPDGAAFGNLTTTPLIVDGTVYVGDLKTRIHAVDLVSGKRKFLIDSTSSIFGPTGVGVGWGKVFGTKAGPSGQGTMIAAYDRNDGKQLWATDISLNGGAVNIQPIAYDGLVFAATSGYGAGTRGTLYALDVETGAIVWSFAVVEDENLWGHPEINSGGGAWYPPSIDPARGSVFFGTSNPYPFPGSVGFPNGSSRPGNNRWTDSTLALDLGTGALRWGRQAVEHDLFDRDVSMTARVDTEVRGSKRSLVIATGKVGYVYGLDADKGDVLWSTEVGLHDNDELTAITGPTKVLPGSVGGVETPIAVADNTVFVSVVNAAANYSGPEQTSFGGDVDLGSRPGELVAIDVSTGAVRWKVDLPGDAFGGATVVGDLVFTSTFDGVILAFDRATGEERWRYQAPGNINGWPAVSGDTIVYPVGLANPPQLLAFRLPT